VFDLPEVDLEPGSEADLVVFDPEGQWTVDPGLFFSKGRNTPFAGWTLTGRVLATMMGGRFTHLAPEVDFEHRLVLPAEAMR